MKRAMNAIALTVLTIGAFAPVQAQEQKGDKGNGKGQRDVAALVQAGEVTGKITKLGSGGSFTLQLIELKAQGGGNRGPLQQGRRPVQIRPITKAYELETVDDVIVRVLEKPIQFDDKGKPKPYTPAELKELKGPDASLPGYRSDFYSLKVGQTVRVAFGRRPTRTPMAPTEETDKEKTKTPSPAADRARVGVIVVIKDPERTTPRPEQKSKPR